jgi:hypothetical protein
MIAPSSWLHLLAGPPVRRLLTDDEKKLVMDQKARKGVLGSP